MVLLETKTRIVITSCIIMIIVDVVFILAASVENKTPEDRYGRCFHTTAYYRHGKRHGYTDTVCRSFWDRGNFLPSLLYF